MQKSQCDQVLRHLKRGSHIDAYTALRRYGIMRLAARVCELRERGHDVHTQMFRSRNGKRFARYHL